MGELQRYRVVPTLCSGETHNNNICTAFFWSTQWATIREPVTIGVVANPVDDCFLCLCRDVLALRIHALKRIVDVFGDAEDTRVRFWHYNCQLVGYLDSMYRGAGG